MIPDRVIRNLLVDLDGTLVRTKEANAAAYRAAFSAHALPFDAAAFERCFGFDFAEMIKRVAPEISAEKAALIKSEKAQLYPTFFDLVHVNQTLAALLRSQKSRCRLVLVTTATTRNATAILQHCGLADLFDFCLFREDVGEAKPSPEVYLKALRLLEAESLECLAFEDSSSGLQAASAAGIPVLRIE